MVTKNAKEMKCLITRLMAICKPCLEKSSKGSSKIYQLFARIPYDSYFGKYLKICISVIPRRAVIMGLHLSKFGSCEPTTFQKNSTWSFFWSLVNFFRRDIKNNSWWIAEQQLLEKILSKKVKRVLQRRRGGTGVAMELQKKTKW